MKLIVNKIVKAVVQRVGNKLHNDGVSYSSETTDMHSVQDCFCRLVNASIKTADRKHFTFVGGLELNPVYRFVSNIFNNPDSIVIQANNLARYLYEQSVYPTIGIGEFSVVLFEKCLLDGKERDVIGLFKSESVDSVLKVSNDGRRLNLVEEHGMSLKKLDNGCLIFNVERDNGYVVMTTHSKAKNADYWIDSFLHLGASNDSYHTTLNYIEFSKAFIESEHMHGIKKHEKAVCINRAIELLSNENDVSFKSFLDNVFGVEHQQEALTFKKKYETSHNVAILNEFSPSKDALKRQSVSPIRTIKLDNNFDIKVKSDKNLIEQGYDSDKQMNYLKIFYIDEK